jgi:hypothetical protein
MVSTGSSCSPERGLPPMQRASRCSSRSFPEFTMGTSRFTDATTWSSFSTSQTKVPRRSSASCLPFPASWSLMPSIVIMLYSKTAASSRQGATPTAAARCATRGVCSTRLGRRSRRLYRRHLRRRGRGAKTRPHRRRATSLAKREGPSDSGQLLALDGRRRAHPNPQRSVGCCYTLLPQPLGGALPFRRSSRHPARQFRLRA